MNITRSHFLKTLGICATGYALSEVPLQAEENKNETEVSVSEDLMREHGVLRRILLIYEESIRHFDLQQNFPPRELLGAAEIVQSFIENYHEKLEEDYLFPRFEKANQLKDLVKTLREQHDAGRRLTNDIKTIAGKKGFNNIEQNTLRSLMKKFIRMYRPHAAREDTVLFPAFKKLVSKDEYSSLAEEFEKKEHELFGSDGFEMMVSRVENLEKNIGIYDLNPFTPRAL